MSKHTQIFKFPISTKFHKLSVTPLLSIVILTKNNFKTLRKCLNSIIDKTKYQNYNIYIGDTGSNDNQLNQIKSYIHDKSNMYLIEYDYYNFSKNNNDIVLNHIDPNTKWVCLCNDDIEFLNDIVSNVFTQIETSRNKHVGCVGIRHHYPNGLSLHAGLICIFSKNDINVGHLGYRQPRAYDANRENCFGVTAATIFIPIDIYKSNQLNELYLDSYQDVEFCINNLLNDKLNMYCGEAVALHHESMTRKKEGISGENFIKDQQRLKLYIRSLGKNLFDKCPNKSEMPIGQNEKGFVSV